MNAPHDGDRGQAAGNSGHPEGPPPEHGQVPPQPPRTCTSRTPTTRIPTGRRTCRPRTRSPKRSTTAPRTPAAPRHLSAAATALRPAAAVPVPSRPARLGPDPAPEPDGPTQYLPYGDDPRTTQYVGVDDLVTHSSEERHEPDAFAHLFRDQQQGSGHPQYEAASVPGQYPAQGQYGQYPAATPPPPAPEAPAPAPAAAATKKGGRAGGLLKSSAVMAAGTMVSRLTGFIRSALIVSALGVGLLGDTFQVAYQLPTMIYILTVGGGLNSVFVPQLVRAMKEDDDGGEAYANRLLTLVMVALGALTALSIFGAPLLIRLLSDSVAGDPAANQVGVTFVQYFLPSIFFMGIHVVMGQILNARGKFGAMMWTPVLNNIVIIMTLGMFIWVYGTAEHSGMTVTNIPPEGQRLLGIGVLLGLVVQALAMIPYLRETGFRLRLRFDWKGHGLGKAVTLAKWTFLFVLANQAGALVVTQLSTAAGKESPSTAPASPPTPTPS